MDRAAESNRRRLPLFQSSGLPALAIAAATMATLRVVRDGIFIGLAFATVPILIGGGEPSVTPTWIDRSIWFTVLALVGVFNTTLVYACCIVRRYVTERQGG